MARAFLKSVSEYIHEHYKDTVENLCIILPNKRGALFLKNYLAQSFGKTIWLPEILSAEELITELSGLKTLEEIDLVCHLYESYKVCYGNEAENFESFARWGQLILQDFNEIDRYLADSEQLYENLKDIKVIENWSLGEENLSEYQQNYLKFMNSLGAIYKHFSTFLLSNHWAYQGLAYKQAVANLAGSSFGEKYHKLLFCGFNALNAAEIRIFKTYHDQGKADVLWDADEYYLNPENLPVAGDLPQAQQEAGMFLRNNLKLFSSRDARFIEQNFKEAKDIHLISVPKQIGQAQVVRQTLESLIEKQIPLDRVAVVLANEKLLWPVLQQLPAAVEHVNITMEYPLRYTSTYAFIDQVIQLQTAFAKQKTNSKTIYHNDLIALFRQPLFVNYLHAKKISLNADKIITQIKTRNLSFISQNVLQQLLDVSYTELTPLLIPAKNIVSFSNQLIEVLKQLIGYFSEQQQTQQNSLELEYLHIVLRNSNRLHDILQRYPHFSDIHSFRQLFSQVVGNSTAPFIGEPLRGLQIMGVLETRTLDFDHLILVNVNEGVLPSGKSINSFIPNDLKRAFGLPLYLEKDAVYAYHFYRLLQKANDITITYDSETDSFGKGEKSRFITQLQLEMPRYNPAIRITEQVANYKDFPEEKDKSISVSKDDNVLSAIFKKASSNDKYGGFSPSGLLTYKDCGLKFYFRYGARLKETEEVEENAEANTFGSILHLSLETLYKPLITKVITESDLERQNEKTDQIVNDSFVSFFDNNPPTGKSILQLDVVKVYVKKLVENDLRFIRNLASQNRKLELNSLEQEFSAPLTIKVNGIDTTIFIKGKIDRIDSYGGIIRVIDYKSSVKDSDKFSFDGLDLLFEEKNYDKQLQLFLYTWLLHKSGYSEAEKIIACIVPFKEFAEEPKFIVDGFKKPFRFNTELMQAFENKLRSFAEQVFDRNIPFSQTSDKKAHEFCPYNAICLL